MTDETPKKRMRGRPRSTVAEEPAATVQALERGLMLMKALARSGAATLTELSLIVGMPAATAHRFLATLHKHDFVAFDKPTQTWSIGVQAMEVGASFSRQTNFIEASRAVMRDLMRETGETSNLGLEAGGEIVFVSQVETTEPIRAFFPIGTRGPMHATGIGKALLARMEQDELEAVLEQTGLPDFTAQTLTTPKALFADLEATRQRGWALDDEERHLGMRCVACAIRNVHGEAFGGVSISGPSVRLTDGRLAEIGAIVRRSAEDIETRIGVGRPNEEIRESRP